MKESLKGGNADGLTLKDIAKKHNVKFSLVHRNFLIGLKIESEHTRDKMVASEIVRDHLSEMPDYYTNQYFQGLLKDEKRRSTMSLKHAIIAATILAKKGYDVEVDTDTGNLILAHVDEDLGDEECAEGEEVEEVEEGDETVEGAVAKKSTPASRAKARLKYKKVAKKVAKKRSLRKKAHKAVSPARKKAAKKAVKTRKQHGL